MAAVSSEEESPRRENSETATSEGIPAVGDPEKGGWWSRDCRSGTLEGLWKVRGHPCGLRVRRGRELELVWPEDSQAHLSMVPSGLLSAMATAVGVTCGPSTSAVRSASLGCSVTRLSHQEWGAEDRQTSDSEFPLTHGQPGWQPEDWGQMGQRNDPFYVTAGWG